MSTINHALGLIEAANRELAEELRQPCWSREERGYIGTALGDTDRAAAALLCVPEPVGQLLASMSPDRHGGRQG